MIRILEWKASSNARFAFGFKNGLKPCSLETIKQIFTRSKKKKLTPTASALSGFEFGWFLPNGHVYLMRIFS
jgi:hypothetical protein